MRVGQEYGVVMRHAVAALVLLLGGCGSAYLSPSVQQDAAGGLQVHVLPMAPAVVADANAQPYTPRALPRAFYDNGPGGALPAGGATLPAPAMLPEARPAQVTADLPPPPPDAPYRIGVGDVVLIATTDTAATANTVTALTGLLVAQSKRQGYTVQDDGAIAIPDIGRVKMAGMTLEEAENALFQAIVAKQMTPAFSLEVAEFHSQQVSVGGAVRQPGVTPITLTPLYLDQAIAAVGGVTVTDEKYAIVRIYRGGRIYQVPLKDAFATATNKRIRLVAGDSIFVDTEYDLDKAQAYFAEQIQLMTAKTAERQAALAELNAQATVVQAQLTAARSNFKDRLALGAEAQDYVYLTGEVSKPARFGLPFGNVATLADALYSQGGFSNVTGNPRQIYVLRADMAKGGMTGITAYQLDGRNAANMIMATQFQMRPNDIVFIAQQPITKWNRVLSQLGPSLVTASVNKL